MKNEIYKNIEKIISLFREVKFVYSFANNFFSKQHLAYEHLVLEIPVLKVMNYE